jgi:hypothetical protein
MNCKHCEIDTVETEKLTTEMMLGWIDAAFARLDVAPDGRLIGLDARYPEHQVHVPAPRAIHNVADVMRHHAPTTKRDYFTAIVGGPWWARELRAAWGRECKAVLTLRGEDWRPSRPVVRAWLDHVVTPIIARDGGGASGGLVARNWRTFEIVADVWHHGFGGREDQWSTTLSAIVTY